jgi:hypothetical protein
VIVGDEFVLAFTVNLDVQIVFVRIDAAEFVERSAGCWIWRLMFFLVDENLDVFVMLVMVLVGFVVFVVLLMFHAILLVWFAVLQRALIERQQVIVPISIRAGAHIRWSYGGSHDANIGAFSGEGIKDEKRIRLCVDALYDSLAGPFPSHTRVPKMSNVLMGAEWMRFVDAGHLYVCHVRILSDFSQPSGSL